MPDSKSEALDALARALQEETVACGCDGDTRAVVDNLEARGYRLVPTATLDAQKAEEVDVERFEDGEFDAALEEVLTRQLAEAMGAVGVHRLARTGNHAFCAGGDWSRDYPDLTARGKPGPHVADFNRHYAEVLRRGMRFLGAFANATAALAALPAEQPATPTEEAPRA